MHHSHHLDLKEPTENEFFESFLFTCEEIILTSGTIVEYKYRRMMPRLFCVYCAFLCSVLVSRSLSETTTNFPLATTDNFREISTLKNRYEDRFEDFEDVDSTAKRGRAMMMPDHDEHHDMPEQKAVKEDPWTGYYDFIINEGSFKFWAVFQLVTALLLVYSAFAAVYYAKFNVITSDYDYYDDFLGRSNSDSSLGSSVWSGLSAQTFQRIFDALSSKKYS